MVPRRTCSHGDRPVPVVTACPLEKLKSPAGWQQSSGSTAPGDGCSRSRHAWVGFHWATYRPARTDMCFEFSIVTRWNHTDRHSFLWNQLAFWQPHELPKEGTLAPCCPRSTGGLRESPGWLCLTAIQGSISQSSLQKLNPCGLIHVQKWMKMGGELS